MTLEFALNQSTPATATTDCVIVGVFADKVLSPAAQAVDSASGGRLQALVERGDVSGKTGRTALLHDLPGVAAPRVLVVGLRPEEHTSELQSLMRISYAVFCLKKKTNNKTL